MRAVILAAVSSPQQATDDKHSIASQIESAKAWCAKNDHVLVDTLTVVHSRDYVDFHEAAADMRRVGQDGFDRLNAHWQACDFDVLIVAYGSRLGRTASLHSYIVERTIKELGMTIYVMSENMLYTRDNFRFWNTLSAHHAAAENDERTRRRLQTIDAMVMSGVPLPIGRPIWTHRIVRDPDTGRRLYPMPKDEIRPVFDALATLILEGVPYYELGMSLYARFGILDTFPDTRNYRKPKNQTPRPFSTTKLFRTLFNPTFWGHTAQNYRASIRHNTPLNWRVGLWMLDDREAPPPDVHITYNTHEAVYTGELAERVKDEMTRRSRVIMGKAKPKGGQPFTGLLVCHECGYRLVSANKGAYMRCDTPYQRKGRVRCSQTKVLPAWKVETFFDRLLGILLAGDESIFNVEPSPAPSATVTDTLNMQIASLDSQIKRLIDLGQYTNQDVTEIAQRVNELTEARRLAIEQRDSLLAPQRSAQAEHQRRKLALADIEHIRRVFWKQPPSVINQTLHRVMGDYRVTVTNGLFMNLISCGVTLVVTGDIPQHPVIASINAEINQLSRQPNKKRKVNMPP